MTMPALFVGHGSPMNALEDNAFTRAWQEVAAALPRPRAVLCVSAHWETEGPRVTAQLQPRTAPRATPAGGSTTAPGRC
jgi:4,5-DOPA dioxygenase extradiol